jgi:hypothetical protein
MPLPMTFRRPAHQEAPTVRAFYPVYATAIAPPVLPAVDPEPPKTLRTRGLPAPQRFEEITACLERHRATRWLSMIFMFTAGAFTAVAAIELHETYAIVPRASATAMSVPRSTRQPVHEPRQRVKTTDLRLARTPAEPAAPPYRAARKPDAPAVYADLFSRALGGDDPPGERD